MGSPRQFEDNESSHWRTAGVGVANYLYQLIWKAGFNLAAIDTNRQSLRDALDMTAGHYKNVLHDCTKWLARVEAGNVCHVQELDIYNDHIRSVFYHLQGSFSDRVMGSSTIHVWLGINSSRKLLPQLQVILNDNNGSLHGIIVSGLR